MSQGTVRRIERSQVVVVGAGQAGLAAAWWLARHDLDFIVLDAHVRVGDSWRRRWDSLQLFTPARYSGLPGLEFPGDPYHLPRKDEVADYLEWYSQAFDLPVRAGVRVASLRRRGALFTLSSDSGTFEAENVIVATGPFHTPFVPVFASDLDPSIMQLHSSEYRNPDQLPAGNVLVVGAGNSGTQIAIELVRSRPVTLAGPSVGSLPRRVLGRDVYDWLWPVVMRPGRDTMIGRRLRKRGLSAADPLIGLAEREIAALGVRRTGRVVGVRDGLPLLFNGSSPAVSSIVWATGFRPCFRWVDLPVFGNDGMPRHSRGAVGEVPGLYFLGLRWLHRLNSSLIGGVGADAAHVTRAILSRYGE